MTNLSVGLAIRKLRDEQGMSAKELCEVAGFKDYELSRIERGQQKLDLMGALRVSKALGTSMNRFCDLILQIEPQVQDQRVALETALHARKKLTELIRKLETT